jgi:hypothetical protein
MRVNGYEYEPREIRGNCSQHKTPLVNTPHVIAALVLDRESRDAAGKGLWGVGYCPAFRHFETWYLPPFEERPGATESDPLGYGSKIKLDKIDIFQ